MFPMRPNAKTGFLESNPGTSFDSVKKVKFLELAQSDVDANRVPNVPAISKAIGIDSHTFYSHRMVDEAFRNAWENIIDQAESRLIEVMYENGQKPSGYMDRITWLRANRPKTWNPDLKVTVGPDQSTVKSLTGAANLAIEADIVENPPIIALQPGEKP